MQSVRELSGQELDAWVARAEGVPTRHWRRVIFIPRYSTDWRAGGPIIGREGIHVGPKAEGGLWYAFNGKTDGQLAGATPLEAAMRCYVASKFGEVFDENPGQ